MILRFVSGVILIVAFTAAFYLDHYTGRLIFYPFLWELLCLGIAIGAAYLIYVSFRRAAARKVAALATEREERKKHCEMVVIDIDHSVIKAHSFEREVEAAYTGRVQMADSLYDSSRDYKTEGVRQSVIVFRYPQSAEAFISHSFAIDEAALRYYIITGRLRLYIERHDRQRYWFEVAPD